MTLQKIAPLILCRYLITMGWGLIFIVVVSTFVGSMGGLNQSSLRKLMAFSSINHLGWLLVSVYFGYKILIVYFSVYCLTNGILVLIMGSLNFFYLSQLFYYTPRGLMMLVLYFNWLSFGGLPPFIGFFPK